MNTRTMILAALLLGTAACVGPQAAAGPRNEKIAFNGYRLEVTLDEMGKPVKAQAYDAQNNPVPTAIIPLSDASICVPKPPHSNDGPSPYCEPLSYFPDRVSFKSGSKTLCHTVINGQLVYYKC